MRVLKVMVTHDDVGDISIIDAIENEGAIWLVPTWLEVPIEGWKTPARMFLMNQLQHQPLGNGFPAEYNVSEPLPRALFDGGDVSKLGTRFFVQDAPIDIRIPIPKGMH